ncbi:hypothetical protein [Pseudomonas aylmerensis]|uniref:hypothetical protein n=1 Tax=Pseudomonas aylmerensis TaxID=1869229 RepID=UPI001D012DB6|nr:hypothetical protein [Pseudomonas aylmerensis]
MGFFPLITQADGVANGALKYPGLGALVAEFLDTPFNILEGSADGRTDSTADDDAKRQVVRHGVTPKRSRRLTP